MEEFNSIYVIEDGGSFVVFITRIIREKKKPIHCYAKKLDITDPQELKRWVNLLTDWYSFKIIPCEKNNINRLKKIIGKPISRYKPDCFIAACSLLASVAYGTFAVHLLPEVYSDMETVKMILLVKSALTPKLVEWDDSEALKIVFDDIQRVNDTVNELKSEFPDTYSMKEYININKRIFLRTLKFYIEQGLIDRKHRPMRQKGKTEKYIDMQIMNDIRSIEYLKYRGYTLKEIKAMKDENSNIPPKMEDIYIHTDGNKYYCFQMLGQ